MKRKKAARGNLRYTQHVTFEIVTERETIVDEALVRFEPDTQYGIDLFMQFKAGSPLSQAPRGLRDSLQNRMRLQHRIRTMDVQYDPSSMVVESQDGDKAVILFRYSKFSLPQQVSWMRRVQGRVWVDGDRVERIRLELDEGARVSIDGNRGSSLCR